MNTRADNVNICTAACISFMVMSSAIIYPATRAHDFVMDLLLQVTSKHERWFTSGNLDTNPIPYAF